MSATLEVPKKIRDLPLPTTKHVKVLTKDDNDRLYLKIFLLDSTVNGNKWGVDPSTLDDNIQSAIGKPLVLYKNTGKEPDRWYYPRTIGQYDHPPWDDADINHTYEMQDTYRVGTLIDVVKNTETGAWWGVAEITNDGVKKALNENPNLPFYVSPSIRRLHAAQANQTIRDWVLMHTAIVSVPAFGVQKAYATGRCAGHKDSCLLHFRTASLQDAHEHNQADCGFCTYGAMKEVSEHSHLNKEESRTTHQTNNSDTSHLTFSTNIETGQSLSDPNTQTGNVTASVAAGPETVATTTSTVTQPEINKNTSTDNSKSETVTVEHKTYPQPQSTTVYPDSDKKSAGSNVDRDNNSGNNNNNTDVDTKLVDLIAQNEAKQKQLQAAYNKINKLDSENKKLAEEANSFNTELASLKRYVDEQKQLARENDIADVVLSASLSQFIPDEVKEEQIKLLVASSYSVQDIKDKLVSPFDAAFNEYQKGQKNNNNNNIVNEQVPQNNGNRRNARLELSADTNNTKNASLKQTSRPAKLAFEEVRDYLGLTESNGSSGGAY